LKPLLSIKDLDSVKLIGSLTSPYVRKVRVLALEKKIELDFVLEDVWENASTIATQNPLGKIPVLLVNGDCLFDSRVIVQYLDALAPTQKLIPEANRERAAVRTLEALGDGTCDAAITMMLERRFHPEGVSQVWIDRHAVKVDRALSFMSQALGNNQFMTGEAFSLADIACGVALGYLELRQPYNPWKTRLPNLKEFYDRMMLRPSFNETSPPRG
jgi:glutathione S-transferase